MSGAIRELALFNLAIDTKLRACGLVRLRIEAVWSDSSIRDRATLIQRKTKRPVQFEVTEQTKSSIAERLPFVRRSGGGTYSRAAGKPPRAESGYRSQPPTRRRSSRQIVRHTRWHRDLRLTVYKGLSLRLNRSMSTRPNMTVNNNAPSGVVDGVCAV